jgi:SOS-response transcriptional repressor LexA
MSQYLLRMRSDHLAPEIQEGDHLVVRQQDHAEEGQLVVALVDDGESTTVRRHAAGDEGVVIGLVTDVMGPRA